MDKELSPFELGYEKAFSKKEFRPVEDNQETRGYFKGLGYQAGGTITDDPQIDMFPSLECLEFYLNGLRDRIIQDFEPPHETLKSPFP